MNDQTEILTGTALALPEPASLAVLFQKPDQIAADIANALRTMAGKATPEAIADALIAGKIPHVKVEM